MHGVKRGRCVQVESAKRPRLVHIGIVAGLKNSLSLKVLGVHFSCIIP